MKSALIWSALQIKVCYHKDACWTEHDMEMIVCNIYIQLALDGRLHCSLWVLYQRSGALKGLDNSLAIPRARLFWTEISDVVPEFYWRHYFILVVT